MSGDGGQFQRVSGIECQYKELMARVIRAGWCQARDVMEHIFRGAAREEVEAGRPGMRMKEMLAIGGRRRKDWGGMETNEMCVGMSKLMDWFKEE